MPNKIDIFKKAAALRDQLTAEQSKRIQKMYEDLAKKIAKEAKNPKYSVISSGSLTQQYLNQLKKQVEAWSKELSNGLFTTTQGTMNLISDAVVSDSVDWLHSLGLGTKKGIAAAFSNVNQSVVNAILTGSVYGQAGSWSLSKSIWGDNQKNLSKIYALIAEGYAAQMPVGDIADMISKYVDPTKKLDWTGPDGKRIYGHKVDYNAQRLVRTISQHTYQQSIVQCAQDNPFISGFIWHANGSRVCEVCKKRDGKFYKKDELPLDHPNGMCVMEPVVSKNMSKDLAGWVKGTNKNPEIDAFAKKLGYQPKEADGLTLGDIKKKYGDLAKGKKVAQFQHKLPKDVQEQLKKLKQDSGLSWDDFFTKNFDGAVSEKVKAVKKAATTKAIELNKDLKAVEDAIKQINGGTTHGFKLDSYKLKDLVSDDLYKKFKLFDDNLYTAMNNTYYALVFNVARADRWEALFDAVRSGKLSQDVLDMSGFDVINQLKDAVKKFQEEQYFKSKLLSKLKPVIESQTEKAMFELAVKDTGKLSDDAIHAIIDYSGSSYVDYNEYLRALATGAKYYGSLSKEKQSMLDKVVSEFSSIKTTEDYVLRRGTDIDDVFYTFVNGNNAVSDKIKDELQNAMVRLRKDITDDSVTSEIEQNLNNMLKGQLGSFGSFTSTSSEWRKGFVGDVEYIIDAPKGTAGTSVTNISEYGTKEGEFLLAPNTKVMCEKVEVSKDRHKRAYLRVFIKILV